MSMVSKRGNWGGKKWQARKYSKFSSKLGKRNYQQPFYKINRQPSWYNGLICINRVAESWQDIFDGDTFLGMQFQLNSLPSYNDFTDLFEMYKIQKVELRFMFSQTMSECGPGAAQRSMPNLILAYDPNDASTPVAKSDLLEHQGVCVQRLDKVVNYTIYPKAAVQMYTAVGTAYATQTKAMWLDCNNVQIPHYGLKICFEGNVLPGTPTGAQLIGRCHIWSRFTIELKNPH